MSEKTYRIKPLEWERGACPNCEWCASRAVGGSYRVERWRHAYCDWRGWCWAFESDADTVPEYDDCATAEEGMALAEAHWRETITRFLEEVAHE